MPENTSIEVKEGTISISPCAFEYCRSLTSITIPKSVTSIGEYAFYDCSSLTSITIPESSQLTSIGTSVFYGCSSLTSIIIPESVTSIGREAFYGCSSLTAVHIKDIASWCNINFSDYIANPLYYAKNLYLNGELVTELTIPNTVTAIKSYAFVGCSSLTSITIPESVTSIGNYAFNGCTSLKELVIADGSKTLSLGYNKYDDRYTGKGLFYDCPLETIYLGRNLSYDSREKCGYSPFYNQKALTSVTIGESVTSIGESAFRDCRSLTAVHIKDIASWCNIDFSDYIANPLYYAKNLYLNGELVTELTIPNTVTAIKSYAFVGCSSLTSITIPENSKLASIEKSAFSGCSSLTSITIPEGVTSIEDFAFNGCTSLKELVIADGSETLSLGYNMYDYYGTGEGLFYDCPLETIYLGRNLSYDSSEKYGYSPFYNKKALTSVTIGASVTSIGNCAFRGCTSLKELVIADGSETLLLGYNMYYYGTKGLFYDCPLETVYLGRNLSYSSGESYGYSPFYNKKALTSVTIGDSVTSIEDYAFNNCNSLNKVYIKDIEAWCNIKFGNINSNPLYYAHNLYLNGELVTELTIPNTVTAIKSYAFVGCSSLTSVTIPESVTSIGSIAFYECSGLTSITIPENLQLTSIGQSVFCRCSSLTSITIPESVTSIGDWAFSDCSSLTSITIPENSQLTSIGYEAFRGCSNLTSLTIPESVTSIGDNAFIGCSNVENLVVKGSAMPHVPSDKLKKIVLYSPAPLQSKGFSSTVYQNCMLYVPQQGLARYQIVEPWAYFWNIIAFDTSDIAPAELPEDDSDPIIYDLRGQRVDVPTRGNIYIVNGRKVLY